MSAHHFLPSGRRARLASRALALLAGAVLASRGGAQQTPAPRQPVVTPAGTSDLRPTVAVLYFTNGALVGGSDYAPLSKGMAEMMITELARNPGIRVVERDQLQQLLAEQNLGSGDRVDKETAVKLGRILGAHHLLMGAFVIDPRQNMRIDVRSVNTETSQIEYVESVSGKADHMLEMVDELGGRVNQGLKLPPLPAHIPSVSATVPGGPNQLRAMMLMSRALEQQDKGNTQQAIALYKGAVDAAPDFDRAKVRLAALEKSSGSTATP